LAAQERENIVRKGKLLVKAVNEAFYCMCMALTASNVCILMRFNTVGKSVVGGATASDELVLPR
jgi:hypothetical protein